MFNDYLQRKTVAFLYIQENKASINDGNNSKPFHNCCENNT